MKLHLIVVPNGQKNLHDTMYDIIEKKANAGFWTFGVKLGYDAVTFLGNGTTNFVLQKIIFPMFKDNASVYLTDAEFSAVTNKTNIKLIGNTAIVTLDLNEIDYLGILKRNLDTILDAVKKIYPDIIAWDILDILSDDKDTAVNAVLNSVSDSKKEEIVKLIIKKFETNFCNAITDALKDQEIELAAKNLTVG